MQSSITTRGSFRTAMTAGAVALAIAGGAVAVSDPASAEVRFGHGGHMHHPGGFAHRGFGGFGHHHGRHLGGYGFRHGGFAYRPYGFGHRRLSYRVGVPYGVYGVRLPRCGYGRHFVPGLGCRLNVLYRPRVLVPAYRPWVYGARRVVRPYGYAADRHVGHRPFGFGYRGFVAGHGRPFGHVGHGFRQVGFGHHGGFHPHHGFGHGGHVRHR